MFPQTYPERDEDFFAPDWHSDRLSIFNAYKHNKRQLWCRNKKLEILRGRFISLPSDKNVQCFF